MNTGRTLECAATNGWAIILYEYLNINLQYDFLLLFGEFLKKKNINRSDVKIACGDGWCEEFFPQKHWFYPLLDVILQPHRYTHSTNYLLQYCSIFTPLGSTSRNPNMKMVFNIYGTWRWVTFEKLMMKIYDFFLFG